MAQPTASQIEFFHQRWGLKFPTHAGNYLGCRKLLIHGGFPVYGGGRVSESLRTLLRELDGVGLPYQVEILPIDRNGVVLGPFNSEAQPNWLDLAESPPAYQGAPQVVVELASVASLDTFVAEMDKHFLAVAIPTRFGKRSTARFGHVRSRLSFEDGRDLPVACRAMPVAFAIASERKRSTAGMVFTQRLSDVSHKQQPRRRSRGLVGQSRNSFRMRTSRCRLN